ncbi:MAG: SIR2 family NAD-dependent protein deacylase [Anaerolineales bacterium]
MLSSQYEPSGEIRDLVNIAARLISLAKCGVVFTGAGISTPSGIPDFRTPGSGLWTRFNPMEVASLSAFRYQPEKFFNWLQPLALQIINALPNPAHYALALLEKAGYLQTIITQNIDGLHQRAGSKQVLEIHGTLDSLTCIGCYQKFPSKDFISQYLEDGTPPRCPQCNHILKPDAILYEEQLPKETWLQAERACQSCSVMLVAGSSLEVTPAALLPHRALENNAQLIIINNTPTYLDSRAAVRIQGDVADILPLISQAVIDD